MSCYLCDELIDEIFVRLPPKSLLRFRSLSKSWYSRIASSQFIRMQTMRSSKNYSRKVLIRQVHKKGFCDFKDFYALYSEDQLALCQGPGEIGIPSLELFPRNFNKIVNSCNGIICLVRSRFQDENIISLWNPSIRRKLSIPNHPSLMYHPRTTIAVGFGYDQITDDYKIVTVSYSSHRGSAKHSLVYSMKTHSWSEIAAPSTPIIHIIPGACFVNGALHWVVNASPDFDPCYIMTFNITTNVFGMIRLPERCKGASVLKTTNNSLAVISYDFEHHNRIWVMKKYNDVASWYVLFNMEHHLVDADVKSVLLLTTNDYLLINRSYEGIKVYNHATRLHFQLFEDTYYAEQMEMCLESLELLDR